MKNKLIPSETPQIKKKYIASCLQQLKREQRQTRSYKMTVWKMGMQPANLPCKARCIKKAKIPLGAGKSDLWVSPKLIFDCSRWCHQSWAALGIGQPVCLINYTVERMAQRSAHTKLVLHRQPARAVRWRALIRRRWKRNLLCFVNTLAVLLGSAASAIHPPSSSMTV